MAMVKLSAIEWVLRMNSTKKLVPTRTISRGETRRNSVRFNTPASISLSSSSAIANLGP